jgi:hypothetical protein
MCGERIYGRLFGTNYSICLEMCYKMEFICTEIFTLTKAVMVPVSVMLEAIKYKVL